MYILSDSMIKHENSSNLSNYMNVKVRSHPGATTEDLIDYVKPIASKKTKNVGYTLERKIYWMIWIPSRRWK